MSIDRKTVEHVARLARLELSGEETERYRRQLETILGYIAKLDGLDLSGVEPLAHAADTENVFRADEPGPCLSSEQALKNAPERSGGFFVVPKIIE